MGRSRFSFSLGGWTASTRALELCRLGQALSPGLHTRGTPGAVVDPAQSQAHPCHADVGKGDVRAHLTETAGDASVESTRSMRPRISDPAVVEELGQLFSDVPPRPRHRPSSSNGAHRDAKAPSLLDT